MDHSPPGQKPRSLWRLIRPDVRLVTRWITWKSVVLSGVVAGVLTAAFVLAGGVDISADEPDGLVARTLLHHVFNASVGLRAHGVAPPADISDPGRALLAAQHYDMVCANCHGRPGFGQSVTALSMNPRPQYLPRVLGQFTDAQLHQILQHGVKYSAMPSWPAQARTDEVWSMVAFLRRLPTLDARSYAEMTAPPVIAEPGIAARDDGRLTPANEARNTPPTAEFLYAAPAAGFADATIRTSAEQACARCHGADGSGVATRGEAPNLTLQDAGYLRAALRAYVSGGRKSGFMQTVAAQLSEGQIDALADRYASLPVHAGVATSADPELVARGRNIAAQGLPARALPACSTCHEGNGTTVSKAPRLAGQSQTYLRRQLGALRRGDRGSTVTWNPMPAEAHDLDDRDIAALAAYYADLPPSKGAPARPIVAPTPTFTAGLAAAKALFETRCVKCHLDGGRGDTDGLYPDLTLQSRPFVAQALYSMRTRARPNSAMTDVVDGLTLEELASLAAYVDGLAPRRSVGKVDVASAARGEALARGAPGCLSCHDAKGTSALPLIPRLQGQTAAYLKRRLDNFALRYDVDRSALNPMPAIAGKLTEAQRRDLANYFAASAPMAKTAHP